MIKRTTNPASERRRSPEMNLSTWRGWMRRVRPWSRKKGATGGSRPWRPRVVLQRVYIETFGSCCIVSYSLDIYTPPMHLIMTFRTCRQHLQRWRIKCQKISKWCKCIRPKANTWNVSQGDVTYTLMDVRGCSRNQFPCGKKKKKKKRNINIKNVFQTVDLPINRAAWLRCDEVQDYLLCDSAAGRRGHYPAARVLRLLLHAVSAVNILYASWAMPIVKNKSQLLQQQAASRRLSAAQE